MINYRLCRVVLLLFWELPSQADVMFWRGFYRMHWTAEGSVFGAVSLCFCSCMQYLGNCSTDCANFTGKTCLVPRSDEFKGQGQRSKV